MFGQNMLIRLYELRTLHQHIIIIIDKEIITSATTTPQKKWATETNKHTYIHTYIHTYLPYVCTKEREREKRERVD
jgi:hypothetical protein